MSAPGGGFGEGGHDDEANSAPAGGRVPEQPAWQPPWEPPPADYPPPAYAPPGYQPGYPPEYPPPVSPPPGYGQPPGNGGPPYPPGPPQFGGPPPCYGPPPYPGGGYPGGYRPTDYQGRAGTNGLAIASLVSSFTGFLCCFIGSIAAIVLGAIALSQIKHTREEGYGLAVAGIVIGVGTLVVFVIIALFSIIPANSH